MQLEQTRTAQATWRDTPIHERLRIIASLRSAIGADPSRFASACQRENIAESLAAEVLPIADACRFLAKTATRTLAKKSLSGRGRAAWLRGVSVELHREPLGVVLVVAPSNYPLMLPGIQALQALAAGNAVLWKPAPGCSESATVMRRALVECGLDEHLLTVLPEDVGAVADAVAGGTDKVVLTGSVPTGQAIQRLLADQLVPSTMELSGCDAMFVTATADLDRAAKCLVLGLTMNDSRTCIAPRRVFVERSISEPFRGMALTLLASRSTAGQASSGTRGLIDAALAGGAEVLNSDPTVLAKVTPEMAVARADVFEPVTSLMEFKSIDGALAMNDACPYALGATVFGRAGDSAVEELVRRINAGCVVVNDMIVPTADPRVPFGGRGKSGFGVTRGTAGLEEMTRLKAVVRRGGSWLPHLDEPTPLDAEVLSSLIQTLHAPGLFARMKQSLGLMKAAMAQRKFRQEKR